MSRMLVFVYGVIAYAAFVAAILYLIGFTGAVVVPKHINSGPAVPLGPAVAVNLALVLLFAVQHTIMARGPFKAWLTRWIPAAAERSTFVLVASLILLLLFWQWRPIDAMVWDLRHPALRTALWALFAFGWALVFASSFLIDHFDLFGLRQVMLHLRRREYRHHPFLERSIYKLVRHPLMLGFLIAFWAAPTMTAGHLLFAGAMTGYILIGIRFEERDLVRHHGSEYADYRQRTPMLIPRPWRRRPVRSSQAAEA